MEKLTSSKCDHSITHHLHQTIIVVMYAIKFRTPSGPIATLVSRNCALETHCHTLGRTVLSCKWALRRVYVLAAI